MSSSELCDNCRDKIRELGIPEESIDFFREVKKLSQRDRGLQKVHLLGAELEDNLIVGLVGKGEAGYIIGRRGKVAKKLEKKLKKRVRILEVPYDYYDAALSILKPARILGINLLFLPQGKEKYKVRLQKWDMVKLPSDINSLEKLLTKFMGKEVILYFE